MSDSLRQQIFTKIKTRFEGITQASGYQSNLGQNLFEWKTTAFKAGTSEGIKISDPLNTVEQVMMNVHQNTLTVLADLIFVAPLPAPEARKRIADIYRAIGMDRTWDDLAQDTDPQKDEMDIKQDGVTVAGARVTFLVKFRTKSFDPYTKK